MKTRILSSFALALGLFTLAGCGDDPAANVPKAVTAPPKAETSPKTESAVDVAAKTAPIASDAKPSTALSTTPTVSASPTTVAIAASDSSKISFVGGKKVGAGHSGGFKTWSGTVDLVPGKPEIAKINVDIATDSVWADDEKLTGHLKNADFFEVTKYPKTTFVTTEIKAGGDKGATHTLVGNLTLHGVTKSITIPATVKVTDGTVSIVSEFSIKKSDFGMTFSGPGGVIRDEVVIKLDVHSAPRKA